MTYDEKVERAIRVLRENMERREAEAMARCSDVVGSDAAYMGNGR